MDTHRMARTPPGRTDFRRPTPAEMVAAVVTFLCPRCGTTREPRETVCPHCGFNIRGFDQAGYGEKLLTALFHPEPDTSIRAAFLLGFRQPPRAVEALIRRYRDTTDPFLQREILTALNRVDIPEGRTLLHEAASHPSVIVRGEALRCLIARGDASAVETARQDPSHHVRRYALGHSVSSRKVGD
jgi:hypothetical protein